MPIKCPHQEIVLSFVSSSLRRDGQGSPGEGAKPEQGVILKKGALEMMPDVARILYIEFNGQVREIIPKLAQRFQGAGFEFDPHQIAAASA